MKIKIDIKGVKEMVVMLKNVVNTVVKKVLEILVIQLKKAYLAGCAI